MPRSKWLWMLAVAIALAGVGSIALVGGPGSDPRDAPTRGASAAAATEAVAETGQESSSSSKEPQKAVEGHLSNPALDVSQLKRGDLSLELTVEPACAKRGEAMTAKLKAVPGAYVSLIVSYADGQSFGTWYAGPTAPDGTLTYPWVVPPDAAVGQGHVFASGHDPATERSGTVAASFQIAGDAGC